MGNFDPPEDIFQCLETFLSVITVEGVCATGSWWVGVKNSAKHPTMHRIALHNTDVSDPESQQGQGCKTLLQALCFYWAGTGSMMLRIFGRKSSSRGRNWKSIIALVSLPSWPRRTVPTWRHVQRQPFLPFAPTGLICSCWGNCLKKPVSTMALNNFYSILVISLLT